jgi:hypothetical protein
MRGPPDNPGGVNHLQQDARHIADARGAVPDQAMVSEPPVAPPRSNTCEEAALQLNAAVAV